MNEFLLVIRRDYNTKSLQPSSQELEAHKMHWQNWYKNLNSQNVLAKPIQQLEPKGFLVKSANEVVEGPYPENPESIGGYLLVKANDYEAAVEIAKTCPILELNGNVEVREAK